MHSMGEGVSTMDAFHRSSYEPKRQKDEAGSQRQLDLSVPLASHRVTWYDIGDLASSFNASTNAYGALLNPG